MYDLLVKGGEVLDPGQGLKGTQDIAITGGKFERVAPHIDPQEARRVIDVRGKLVTPGLIDLHTHTFWGARTVGVNERSIHPDLAGVRGGCTTVVDAGTSGSHTFGHSPSVVFPTLRTRFFCFLHICCTGLFVHPDTANRDSIDLEGTIRTIEANRDLILGVKLRMTSPGLDNMGIEMPRLALRAARETGTRFMVHIGDTEAHPSANAPRLTRELLNLMAPGDIVTHMCTPRPGGLLDENGRAVPELGEARQRGVTLDPAHGRHNFSFDVVRRLLDQGVVPDTISTDLNLPGQATPVHSLMETMSKFLALGFSLEDVIRMTTANPARALGMSDTLGAIAVGREADLSVLEVVEGDWEFKDTLGQTLRGEKALVPALTVRAGEVITADWGPHPWGWLPAPGGQARHRPGA